MCDDTSGRSFVPERWWIETDAAGRILNVAEEFARVLNLTPRGLAHRELLLFFPGTRNILGDEMRAAAAGGASLRPLTVTLQPRDRRRFRVIVTLSRNENGHVMWDIARSEPVDA